MDTEVVLAGHEHIDHVAMPVDGEVSPTEALLDHRVHAEEPCGMRLDPRAFGQRPSKSVDQIHGVRKAPPGPVTDLQSLRVRLDVDAEKRRNHYPVQVRLLDAVKKILTLRAESRLRHRRAPS